jgi:hypothetical protein
MNYQLHVIRLKSGKQDIQLPKDHEIVQVTNRPDLVIKAMSLSNISENSVVRTFEVIGCNEKITAPNWKHHQTTISGTFIKHVIEHITDNIKTKQQPPSIELTEE